MTKINLERTGIEGPFLRLHLKRHVTCAMTSCGAGFRMVDYYRCANDVTRLYSLAAWSLGNKHTHIHTVAQRELIYIKDKTTLLTVFLNIDRYFLSYKRYFPYLKRKIKVKDFSGNISHTKINNFRLPDIPCCVGHSIQIVIYNRLFLK